MKGSSSANDEIWTADDVRRYIEFVQHRIRCVWLCEEKQIPTDLCRYIATSFIPGRGKYDDYYEEMRGIGSRPLRRAMDIITAQIYNVDTHDPRNSRGGTDFISIMIVFIVMACVLCIFGIVGLLLPQYHRVWTTCSLLFTFLGPHILMTPCIYQLTVVKVRALFLRWRRLM